jgi:hypothetical protein
VFVHDAWTQRQLLPVSSSVHLASSETGDEVQMPEEKAVASCCKVISLNLPGDGEKNK